MYLGNIASAPLAGASPPRETCSHAKAVETFAGNMARSILSIPIKAQTPPGDMSAIELAAESRHLAARFKSGFPLANGKRFPGPHPGERCLMATHKGVAYQNAAEWKAGRGGLYISDDITHDIICADPSQAQTLLREVVIRMRDRACFGAVLVPATTPAEAAPSDTVQKNIADMSVQELEQETRALSVKKWGNFPDAALKPSRGIRTLMATRNGVTYQNRREWKAGSGLYIPRDPAKEIECGDMEKKPRLLRETLAILRNAVDSELPSPQQLILEAAADKLIDKTTLQKERLSGMILSTPGFRPLPLKPSVMQCGDIYLKLDKSLNRIDNIHPKTEKRFIELGKSIFSAAIMPELGLGPRQYFKVVPDKLLTADRQRINEDSNYTAIFTASETMEGSEIKPEDKSPPEISAGLATAGFLLQFTDLYARDWKHSMLQNVLVENSSGRMKAFDYFSDSKVLLEKPGHDSISATLGKSRAEVSELIRKGEKNTKEFFAKNEALLRTDAQYQEKSAAVMTAIDQYIQTCRDNLAQMRD